MRAENAALSFLKRVVYGERRTPLMRIVNALLVCLSWAYRAAILLYMLPFDMGLRKRHRLSRPVISVGNMTVGGTGKTPMVQYLCRMLVSKDFKPAVLSYGYGGALHGRFAVVSDGSKMLLGSSEAGDEPVMLAKSVPGVPVLVGKDRAASGRVAIDDLGADVLILDDGFQVWKLYRDLDIVLLRADHPFDNGRTLPAGRLREPMTAISRADCVILTGTYDAQVREKALEPIRRRAPVLPVWFARVEPSSLIPLSGGSDEPVVTLRGRRVLALSAIANPESFERTLKEAGAEIVGSARYPDHHEYSEDDISAISASASERRAELIVTTDKDAVKLSRFHFDLPASVLRIELGIEGDCDFWEFVANRPALAGERACL